MRRALVILGLLAVASPAYATRDVSLGFEFCDSVTPGSANEAQYIFNNGSGTDDRVVTTNVRGSYCNATSGAKRGMACSTNAECGSLLGTECWTDPDNKCAYNISPNGAAEWRSVGRPPSNDGCDHFMFRMISMPATVGATSRVFALGAAGAVAYAEVVSSTTYSVSAYFKDNGWRCHSSENDGTLCTDNSDCASFIHGQEFCGPTTFGAIRPLTVGRDYEFVLSQDAAPTGFDGLDISVGLTEAGLARGDGTLPIGRCDQDGWACGSNADCSSRGRRCTNYYPTAWKTYDPEGNDYCTVATQATDCTNYSGNTCAASDPVCSNAGANTIATYSDVIMGAASAPKSYCSNALTTLCTTNSDCSGGGTCDNSWNFNIDNIDGDSSATGCTSTERFARFTPDGDGATLNWQRSSGAGTHASHVDDFASLGTSSNADSLYLLNGAASSGTQTERLDLTALTQSAASGDLYTSGSSSLPGALSITQFISEDDAHPATTTGMHMVSCVWNGTTELCPACTTSADCTGGATGYDCGGETASVCNYEVAQQGVPTDPWAPMSMLIRTQPGGSSWTGTSLSAAQVSLKYHRAAIADEQRTQSLIAEFPVPTQATLRPGIAADQNGDTDKTLCLLGDSLGDELQNETAGRLEDFNNVIDYTRGGTTLRDLITNIKNILDGVEGGYMNGTKLVGSFAKCDYPLIISGFNTVAALGSVGGGTAPPEQSYCSTSPFQYCTSNSTCTANAVSGTCTRYGEGYCRGGMLGACTTNADCSVVGGRCLSGQCSNHGLACSCQRNSADASDLNDATYPHYQYCLHNKAIAILHTDWLTPNNGFCSFCATNADCKTRMPCTTSADCNGGSCTSGECTTVCGHCSVTTTTYCASNSDCTGGAGTCTTNACAYDATDQRRVDKTLVPSGNWMLPGCVGTTSCPGGLCVGANQMSVVESEYRELLDAMVNRRCGPNTNFCSDNGVRACTTNSDCAVFPVVLVENGSNCVFGANSVGCMHKERATAAAARITEIAKSYPTVAWIDWPGYAKQHAVLHSPDAAGWCATNTDCVTIGLSTCQTGTCASSACTSGHYGMACARNADCATCLNLAKDNIHHTQEYGVPMLLDAVEMCVENQSGYTDGHCDESTGECTGGKVGDACTADSECALYYCPIGSPPFSWANSAEGLYYLDPPESASTAASNFGDAAVGTTCNLQDNSGVGRSTVTYKQGQSATIHGSAVNTDRTTLHSFRSITGACVDVLGSGSGGDKSWGMWVNPTGTNALGTTVSLISDMGVNNKGFDLQLVKSGSNSKPSCRVGNTSGTIISSTAASNMTAAWHYVMCAYDDAGKSLKMYVDGVLNDTDSTVTEMGDSLNTQISFLGTSASTGFIGYADEISIWNVNLSAAQDCRLCSCGADGEQFGACVCNQNDKTQYLVNPGSGLPVTGQNASFCNSCSMPLCNAAAP